MAGLHQAGFTLVELIIVMVIIGIVGVYAMMGAGSAATYSLPSQAEVLARDLRHAQALASTWGRSLRVTITTGTNGSYSVSCVASGTSPCDVSPVTDPTTGSTFSSTLVNNVVLAGTATLDFDSIGKPSAAASYTISYGGSSKTVSVAPVTGRVIVTTP